MFDAWFTYLTGALGIVSFLLQVLPVFPQYKHLVTPVLIFAVGSFFGSIVASASGSSITITAESSPILMLVIAVQTVAAVLAFIFLLGWAFSRNAGTFPEAAGIAFLVFFGLFLVHLFVAAGAHTDTNTRIDIQEYIVLAKDAEDHSNWTRAIYHYEQAQYRLKRGTPAEELLKEKIEELKLRQVGIARSLQK